MQWISHSLDLVFLFLIEVFLLFFEIVLGLKH